MTTVNARRRQASRRRAARMPTVREQPHGQTSTQHVESLPASFDRSSVMPRGGRTRYDYDNIFDHRKHPYGCKISLKRGGKMLSATSAKLSIRSEARKREVQIEIGEIKKNGVITHLCVFVIPDSPVSASRTMTVRLRRS